MPCPSSMKEQKDLRAHCTALIGLEDFVWSPVVEVASPPACPTGKLCSISVSMQAPNEQANALRTTLRGICKTILHMTGAEPVCVCPPTLPRRANGYTCTCRIWCVELPPKDSGNIVAQFSIKEDAPMRMVVPDDGSFVLLAMGFGGLTRVDIDLAASPPVFQEYTGDV